MGVLRQLDGGLVFVDRLLGLPLRPGHCVGEAADCAGRGLEGGRGREPAGRFLLDGVPKGVGCRALDAVRAQLLQAFPGTGEGGVEVIQVPGGRPQAACAAVDQMLGIVALAELDLPDVGAQTVRRGVRRVADRVGAPLPADILQFVGRLVAQPLDGVAREGRALLQPVVAAHQEPPP